VVATPEHTSLDDGGFGGYVELACRIRVIKDHHTVWYSIGWRKIIGFLASGLLWSSRDGFGAGL
jgi:hypothetical protein